METDRWWEDADLDIVSDVHDWIYYTMLEVVEVNNLTMLADDNTLKECLLIALENIPCDLFRPREKMDRVGFLFVTGHVELCRINGRVELANFAGTCRASRHAAALAMLDKWQSAYFQFRQRHQAQNIMGDDPEGTTLTKYEAQAKLLNNLDDWRNVMNGVAPTLTRECVELLVLEHSAAIQFADDEEPSGGDEVDSEERGIGARATHKTNSRQRKQRTDGKVRRSPRVIAVEKLLAEGKRNRQTISRLTGCSPGHVGVIKGEWLEANPHAPRDENSGNDSD